MADDIILVDEKDNPVGTGEKMDVHCKGILHRAFSILIYNSKLQILLQKRAGSKYHCPGLWTNTCCSHPKPGEKLVMAAERRLKEEMGIEVPIRRTGLKFIYKVKVGELTEHEYDHILCGNFDGNPILNPEEADDWKWISPKDLRDDMMANPEKYTPWFALILRTIGKGAETIPVPGLEKYKVIGPNKK
jgi:isopentenyl-diphosphate delta-isomerase